MGATAQVPMVWDLGMGNGTAMATRCGDTPLPAPRDGGDLGVPTGGLHQTPGELHTLGPHNPGPAAPQHPMRHIHHHPRAGMEASPRIPTEGQRTQEDP